MRFLWLGLKKIEKYYWSHTYSFLSLTVNIKVNPKKPIFEPKISFHLKLPIFKKTP